MGWLHFRDQEPQILQGGGKDQAARWRGQSVKTGLQKAALILPGASSPSYGQGRAEPQSSGRALRALPRQPVGRGRSAGREGLIRSPVPSAGTSLRSPQRPHRGRVRVHRPALGQGDPCSPELRGPEPTSRP